MKKLGRFILHALVVGLLTIFTQVGGLVYIVARLVQRKISKSYLRLAVFPLFYGVAWCLMPYLATLSGRVPLPVFATEAIPLQAQSWILVAANRHYVRPQLRDEVIAIAKRFAKEHEGSPITYLDANFPFLDGFPLLPHRSHDDGRKLDLAFVYQKAGQRTTRAPAFLGYGRVAGPNKGERNYPERCVKKGYWQYSLLPAFARPFRSSKYVIDEKASAQLVRICAKRKHLRKLFLEPHLKQRWRLGSWNKIRFHGCAAVRHDDHLHVQL